MHYVGADLHKEQTWFYVMDHEGRKVLSKSISNKPEKLKEFFETLAKPFELAVEATFNSQISAVAKSIKEIAVNDPDIVNLITIPGIDYFSACIIKTEIIDINRFATFGRLCAYAGLAPRVSQSADKTFQGPLNVNRRKYLQWILMEVSFHFIKKQSDKTEKHKQITSKKGYNTAKVAIARDMLKVIYHVLKEKRPFYFKSGEELTEAA